MATKASNSGTRADRLQPCRASAGDQQQLSRNEPSSQLRTRLGVTATAASLSRVSPRVERVAVHKPVVVLYTSDDCRGLLFSKPANVDKNHMEDCNQ